MKKISFLIAIIAMVCIGLAACGGSEPAEKEYIDESQIDAVISDPDAYKGKWIKISGEVFSVETNDNIVAFQAYHNVDNYEQDFLVYVDKEKVESIKENDFVLVDGKIDGSFEGENAFGGTVTCLQITADTVEVGSYDEMIAPAETTKDLKLTKEQFGISVTLDRVEYANGEARVYITVDNQSSDTVNIWTYDAKAVQDGKQFEHEENFEAGDDDISDVLAGASKDGVLRFKGLDPEKPFTVTIEGYSDDFDIDLEDFVFEVK